MKKIFAILTALALFLAAGCTFAAADEIDVPPSTPEMKAYESYWVSDDGEAILWIGRQDEGFQMAVVRKTSEDSFRSWEYVALFDEETKSIRNANGTRCDCKVADGEESMVEGTGVEDIRADFTIGEDGKLIWKDEEAGTETAFVKVGNFLGRYAYDRANIVFVWNVHENHYTVLADWSQSAWQIWDYQLVGTYDPETETVSFKGLKMLLTYKEDGEIDSDADVEEAELEGTFTLDENGNLLWQSSDGTGDGIVFENLWIPLWANSLDV